MKKMKHSTVEHHYLMLIRCGSLKGPQREETADASAMYRQGRSDFIAHFPNSLDPIPENAVERGVLTCPPVPPSELRHLFEGEPHELIH
ncbi:hypothetical protein SAMN05216374_5937 [Tardiphaga sp. OK246]|uniref:hypothetical protein n=1 Tax=Tardiphaga sp. OK246 TaxID=1855307 RepID=UPI000B753168|nr:hypothetical protein [Tardiphaga sp. OK246]SNT61607.1 hypothetical protein SAMN05216374_5937 [Tardiphaga sp. OK246]